MHKKRGKKEKLKFILGAVKHFLRSVSDVSYYKVPKENRHKQAETLCESLQKLLKGRNDHYRPDKRVKA